MSNFEVALLAVGVGMLALFAFAMSVSRWHERKRHVH